MLYRNAGMTFRQQSGDYAPWFYIRGIPVHSVELLMGTYLVSMIATTIAVAFGHGPVLGMLKYEASEVFQHGELWRLFTYAFWNSPNIPFLLDLTVYFFFGRELERFFGRNSFLYLYTILFLTEPILGILAITFRSVSFSGIPCATGLFVAFATMAPAVTLFLGISAKWLAITFVGIQILSATASNDWAQVILEGGGALVAFLATRYFQGRWVVDALSVFKRNRLKVIQGGLSERVIRLPGNAKPSASPDFPRQSRQANLSRLDPTTPPQSEPATEGEIIDRILEKISASGISSISSAERSLLENARERLLSRDSSIGR